MSWSELERLVETAEIHADLRRALSHCRSGRELVLASRRLGFAIEEGDLRLARLLHGQGGQAPAAVSPGQERETTLQPLERCG